jgi:hypothetical protein
MYCGGCDIPMVAQPLRELPEPQKMDHSLVADRAKDKMVSLGSSGNGYAYATIGISQPPQREMSRAPLVTLSL